MSADFSAVKTSDAASEETRGIDRETLVDIVRAALKDAGVDNPRILPETVTRRAA
jgi:hypothetical protein